MSTILGIESTAHTFGVAVVKNGKILSNVKDSFTTEKGGIIPIEAARHHHNITDIILQKSLDEAKISNKELDAIAFSQGPGLAPCLIEGKNFAKKIAQELNIPIVPVNHCVAHLEIGKTVGATNPVMLYASGANTQIIAYSENFSKEIQQRRKIDKHSCNASGKYRVFGETLDLGVGNFIDTVARFMGMGFPGGPKIAELAEKSKNYIELPYSIKGMDVSFSGMQTKLRQLYETGTKKEDISFSLQETAFAMLVEAAERAMAHTGKTELLLGGGVGCNTRLKEMCEIMCKERGAKFFVPENSLLVDNGAMIAYLGEIMFNAGIKGNLKTIDINSKQRTDDVEVKWK
ncbi:MAG: tRNA (adenosine(37)-N6)-threonylcarbamoyltransferase complex transferase subunit TsaD [Nanoarchaeota archaeon]|nr:tRNA (adenosine(37)-N6)-threonylcarbamoyltransferase complex transferase subunit TsaD [Nanoarchaeota archaeon]